MDKPPSMIIIEVSSISLPDFVSVIVVNHFIYIALMLLPAFQSFCFLDFEVP